MASDLFMFYGVKEIKDDKHGPYFFSSFHCSTSIFTLQNYSIFLRCKYKVASEAKRSLNSQNCTLKIGLFDFATLRNDFPFC